MSSQTQLGVAAAVPAPPPAPGAQPQAPSWTPQAQAAGAGVMMLALVLLCWHTYQGSRFAARPALLQRPEPAPAPARDRETLAATYGMQAAELHGQSSSMSGGRAGGIHKISDSAEKIDLNRAGLDELQRLPGIGPALARRLLDKREQLGGFERVEQLRQVPGIGPKTLDKLRPYIHISGPARSVARGE
jgi:competence ComEA-like helix-hairpin-helix protein